jgi:hypothetical protein
VALQDTLPDSATFVSTDNPDCHFAAGTVDCALGALAAGGSATVKLVATPLAWVVPTTK